MRKILFLSLVLSLLVISSNVSAIEPLTVTIGSGTVVQGTDVDIPINFSNIPPEGINNCNFQINYDPTAFIVNSITPGEIIKAPGGFSYNIAGKILTFLYSDPNQVPITDNGIFATISFDVIGNAIPGNKTLSPGTWVFAKPDLTKITDVVFNNGIITVLKQTPTPTPSPTPTPTPLPRYGDINDDSSIDSIDLAIAQRHVLKWANAALTGNSLIVADVDGSSNVDSIDLAYITRYILGRIKVFPIAATPTPTAMITGTINLDTNTGDVRVNGVIVSGPGSSVSITVIDPDGNPVCVDTGTAGEGGAFEFIFWMDLISATPGTYQVKLGGTGVAEPVILTFEYNPV